MTPLNVEIGTNQKSGGGWRETEVEHQGKSEGKRMKKCSVLNMASGFFLLPQLAHIPEAWHLPTLLSVTRFRPRLGATERGILLMCLKAEEDTGSFSTCQPGDKWDVC